MTGPHNRLPDPEPAPADAGRVPPLYCTLGETLCRVRVYDEEQWQALDPDRRPRTAEYVPGLGWVAADPRLGLE